MTQINQNSEQYFNQGLAKLLAIKDSDLRILTLKQGFDAVDQGIHSGGALSAILPMTAVFYGGFIDLDMEDPTNKGQDMFVLSKGHGIAALASIYADLGYFDHKLLKNSRSVKSLLNGHPGPLLRGVHIATGPLGQGLSAAQGMAMAGKSNPNFNVFCMTGDGELQEGIVWEVFMHAPKKRLDNFCVLIDKNEGQLDIHSQLIFQMDNLPKQIESFGWRVLDVDGTSYESVIEALNTFKNLPKDGRPTAIICNGKKGFGGFSKELFKHKITLNEELYAHENALQQQRRTYRVSDYFKYLKTLKDFGMQDVLEKLTKNSLRIGLKVEKDFSNITSIKSKLQIGKVLERDKKIAFNTAALPEYQVGEQVVASDVVQKCMSVFAIDPRVVSIDSDLGSTSGLAEGIGKVDQDRAINIGIAEANMMCVGEAYAALGFNAWVSTFCPFFNWQVMRRIAVGYQERLESIKDPNGWLSDGHGLDITFLATAPNLETKTNGATHMGNDDALVFSTVAGLKIIDVSCPNQLVSIMKWIMEGNKGLVYLRIMRSPSGTLYDPGYGFNYSKAVCLRGDDTAEVNFVSSGRGVHEAIAAADLLKKKSINAAVYDMPSYDEETIIDLLKRNVPLVLAEQNNGNIVERLGKTVLKKGLLVNPDQLMIFNLTDSSGSYQFIHSGTYGELVNEYGLSSKKMADKILKSLA
jgi:transketolase